MALVRSRRGAVGLIALAALAALPALAQAATVQVTVGGFVKPLNADLQAFYPTRTSVHQGDSVKFVFGGFHTVYFGKPGPPVVPSGATNPPTNDAAGVPFWWAGTPALRGAPKVFLPAGKGVANGTYLSSGAPPGPRFSYTVKFPKVGTFKYGCGLHPGMTGQVTVVPRKGAVPSAADSKALGRAELAADSATARALTKTASARPATSTTITTGPGTARFTLLHFFPKRATVPAGSVVTFKLAGRNEIHTITFGKGPVLQQVGQTFVGPPPVIAFSPLGAYPTDPPGAGIPSVTPDAHGNGLVNSGIVTDPKIPGPSTFKVRFPTPGTYTYACMIHEDMFGTVVVT
jgi:plastocyanin